MRSIFLIAFVSLLLAQAMQAQPRHLYLTWSREDTAHTQTIVFQTLDKATEPRVELSVGSKKTSHTFPAKTVVMGRIGRRIHWITLGGLKAGKVYRFRAGDDRYGMSPWRTFKTLPEDDSPIRIVSGGDMYRHPETVELLDVAATQTPDVALVGGDIAYAEGAASRLDFWDDWLDNWSGHLKGPNGRIVPMILAIGNHEVSGGFGRSKDRAPFYFGFFPQGGEPYFTRKLGSEIDLVVLDSGHVTSHASQVSYLKKVLSESKARFKVALYHVPCYPTHRPYDEYYSTLGRKYWVPVFDEFRVDLAFENHEHVFKRTHPLKNNKIDKEGTVYLGDGCWGRTPRTVTAKRWYHVKASPKEHIWLVQNQKAGLDCRALDRTGQVFDTTVIPGAGKGVGAD